MRTTKFINKKKTGIVCASCRCGGWLFCCCYKVFVWLENATANTVKHEPTKVVFLSRCTDPCSGEAHRFLLRCMGIRKKRQVYGETARRNLRRWAVMLCKWYMRVVYDVHVSEILVVACVVIKEALSSEMVFNIWDYHSLFKKIKQMVLMRFAEIWVILSVDVDVQIKLCG